MGWGWLGMLIGFVVFLLVLGGLVVGIVYLVRALWKPNGGTRSGPGERDRAVGILDERYARGEIGRDEYEERRRTLRGQGPP
ncbi:hypothetical protein BA062_25615 [Prauserella flavalba]|uniref:SHOCT domain-containing protein n=2 Tax=Prauserella TaxID=142577 RepID=A0A318LF44_9PSEU|nr:hypothetical protein BA062_25615 [Prauserella flavalba]